MSTAKRPAMPRLPGSADPAGLPRIAGRMRLINDGPANLKVVLEPCPWMEDERTLPGLECIDVSPPVVAGTCGPCTYEVDPSVAASLDCIICPEEAWSALMIDEAYASSCFQCGLGVEALMGTDPFAFDASSGCQPCDQSLGANAFVDEVSMTWGTWVHASSGCLPCPDQPVEVALGVDDQIVPSGYSSVPAPLDCFGLDLMERRWFLQDEQRSVYGLVDYEGVLVDGYEYDPYGAVLVLTPGSSGAVLFSSADVEGDIDDASSPYL